MKLAAIKQIRTGHQPTTFKPTSKEKDYESEIIGKNTLREMQDSPKEGDTAGDLQKSPT
jgi:hypothetical protein